MSSVSVGPWFPDHIPTSQGVRSLIGKLLCRQVRKRYTAREAVQVNEITNKSYICWSCFAILIL